MILLKYLIAAILVGSDGWFPVEKVPHGPEQVEEVDPSIWVLFAKKLGEENFQVRFPDAPVYVYTESGALQVTSEKDGETFQLTVLPAGAPVPSGDLLYPSEGKWIQEHFVQTEGHIYCLKTTGSELDSPNSQAFISSFSIEKNS